jgi:hypothetical protein
MSFQSFSKLPPPPRNRPKNLPTPDFMAVLTQLCENTDNSYDMRSHVLSIYDQAAFISRLKEKLQRSAESFCKQLRFLGFRRHKEYLAGEEQEEERVVLRYVWRSRKEDYIAKELEFTESHLIAMIARATELRNVLSERKGKLDQQFEKGIFWGMSRSGEQASQQRVEEAVQSAKETINLAHRHSVDIARDVQVNL